MNSLIPLIGMIVVVALPLVRAVQKAGAESAASEFLIVVQQAQQTFRATHAGGGYVSDLASLTTPCPGANVAPLAQTLDVLSSAGYQLQLRAAEGATDRGRDCHGRLTVSDYYAAAAPRSSDVAGQQAFALTSAGNIYVFFDGVAPLERDMAPGGLAIPLEALEGFKIP